MGGKKGKVNGAAEKPLPGKFEKPIAISDGTMNLMQQLGESVRNKIVALQNEGNRELQLMLAVERSAQGISDTWVLSDDQTHFMAPTPEKK